MTPGAGAQKPQSFPPGSPSLRVYCWDCRGELFTSHDCGEDTCCCLDPYDNVPCQTCEGKGYWFVEDTPENRKQLDSSLEEIEYHEVAEELEA